VSARPHVAWSCNFLISKRVEIPEHYELTLESKEKVRCNCSKSTRRSSNSSPPLTLRKAKFALQPAG
jgi:hypothetical protein